MWIQFRIWTAMCRVKMLAEYDMSGLTSATGFRWERREIDEAELLDDDQNIYRQKVGQFLLLHLAELMRAGQGTDDAWICE